MEIFSLYRFIFKFFNGVNFDYKKKIKVIKRKFFSKKKKILNLVLIVFFLFLRCHCTYKN